MRSLDHANGVAAPLNVLGLVGSLRRNSHNLRLLEAASARAPAGATISIFSGLGAVPMFNEDLEAEGAPEAVTRLQDAVARADGVLIATPEYNQSMPAVVKNAVDWLSRAPVLENKPVALMGATVGPWGTRLAQAALRQTLTACGALVMPVPQLYVRGAGEVFDAEGRLADARVAGQLGAFVQSFGSWIAQIRAHNRVEIAT